MKTQVLILFTLIIVSGCQLTRVEGEVDDVEIKVNTTGSEKPDGKFCPPGQSKKGRC